MNIAIKFHSRIAKIVYALLISALLLSACGEEEPTKKEGPITILSLDGGGIRGLILARILAGFEAELKTPIYKQFDVVAGSSSGGIVAILSLLKHPKIGSPLSAKQIEKFYLDEAKTIFTKNQELVGSSITSHSWLGKYGSMLAQIRGPLYQVSAMENLAYSVFGKQKISALVKPALITAFDIEKEQGVVFESDQERFAHISLIEAVRATSAAPTYFAPKKVPLRNGDGKMVDAYLVDGGIYKNNPALLAYRKALALYGKATLKKRGIVLISIGSGVYTLRSQRGRDLVNAGAATWAPTVIDAFMSGSANEDHLEVKHIINRFPASRYVRIETALDNIKHPNIKDLDNIDPANIALLLQAADVTKAGKDYQQAVEALRQAQKQP